MTFDAVITNARVIDPETKLDRVLNIGVKDGAIAAVTAEALAGDAVYDGTGLIAAPGFIDIHTHEDIEGMAPGQRVAAPAQTAACAMAAGNTTIVTGNCGVSPAPTAAYQRALEAAKLPIGVSHLVGNIALRLQVGLDNYTPATPGQIAQMERLLEEGLDAGAIGASFGLQYAPGTSREEMAALCRVVARRGGFAAVHMRHDTPPMAAETVDEVVGIAEETGVPLQISHLAANVYGPGNIARAVARIKGSSADITCDVYPYNVWATGVKSAVFDDGFDAFNFGVEDLEILTGGHAGTFCTEALFRQLRAAEQDTAVACHNAMPIEDVRLAYSLPFAFLGSDGQMVKDADGHIKGHPRGAGSPARFLSDFVRDAKVCTLAEGIAKLTLMPAKRCGFAKKGRLQVGCDADIVLFSLENIKDKAAFGVDVCAKPPGGMALVLAAGRPVRRGAGAKA